MEMGVQTERTTQPHRLLVLWNSFKQLGAVLDQGAAAGLRVEAVFVPPDGPTGTTAQNAVVFCRAPVSRTYRYTLIPFPNAMELASVTRYGGKWKIISMITSVKWPEFHRDARYAALLEKPFVVTTEGET